MYPFGYGLSYRNFEYSNLRLKNEFENIKLSFNIKNVGKLKGKEIAQIYVSQINPKIFKAKKELKEFIKVELEPNEEKKLEITLNREAFQYFNPETDKWSIEEGEYEILIGSSSRDIKLKDTVYIKSNDKNIEKKYPQVYITGNVFKIKDEDFEQILGSQIPPRILNLEDITVDNTLEQIKHTKIGKYIFDNQMEKMNKLLKEQNVNKATKIMMDMQKPLKKFYEKKSSGYTYEMVEELINVAKNDLDFNKEMDFLKLYIK